MKRPPEKSKTDEKPDFPTGSATPRDFIHAFAFAFLFGLGLLKFGNPIIFDEMVVEPKTFIEWLILPWPLAYGYTLISAVFLIAIVIGRSEKRKMPSFFWILLAWLGWEVIAAFNSSYPTLSRPTVFHFAICTTLYFFGWLKPPKNHAFSLFLGVVLIFFIVVCRSGFIQHFGGLADTRKHFFLYVYPTLQNPPLDLIKKIKSDRIFATLFYPNTLAGVILMAVPLCAALLVRTREELRPPIWFAVAAAIFVPGLACMFWSGSKAGWLILLSMILIALVRLNTSKRLKTLVVLAVAICGVIGFVAKYKAFFDRGATSAVARSDYWRAALKIGSDRPIFGVGPGSFGKGYAMIKKPDAEMSKLVHNDYLEQFSDSGAVGFVLFSLFFVGLLIHLYRYSSKKSLDLDFWIWLGLLGVALHSFVEFHLYIPAIAWPYFFLLGRQTALADSLNPIDKAPKLV